MSHDPVKDALAYAANVRAVLANALAAIEVVEAAVRRIGAPPSPAWIPASEFRGEPGADIAVWRQSRPGAPVAACTIRVNPDGRLEMTGLVCPMPPPPPLPLLDAPPSLTQPGAWVPAAEFRGEPGAEVWLAVEPGRGARMWPLSTVLGPDGRLAAYDPQHGLVRLMPPVPGPQVMP